MPDLPPSAVLTVTKVAFTHHARRRLQEMTLTEEQVGEAFGSWVADYPSPPDRSREGNRTRVGQNGLVVAYALKPDLSTSPPGLTALVVTVMWEHSFSREEASDA